MADDKSDPMDGSTADFTPGERARIRESSKWVESSRSVLNPFVVAIKNWQAWAIAIVFVAYLRRPEIAAILDMIGGAGQ